MQHNASKPKKKRGRPSKAQSLHQSPTIAVRAGDKDIVRKIAADHGSQLGIIAGAAFRAFDAMEPTERLKFIREAS